MGLEFLHRVRRTCVWSGAAFVLAALSYAGLARGAALAAGIAWSLVNLTLLERLVVAITGPDRGTPSAAGRAARAVGGMLLLFAAGGVLLMRLPAAWLLAGFVAPFVVLVLKAASILLLRSPAWRRLVASPWRAAIAVLALVTAAAWIVPALVGARPSPGGAGAEPPAQLSGTEAESLGAHAGHAAAGAHERAKGPEKFANLITIITRAAGDRPWAHALHEFEAVIYALLVGLLLCIAAFLAMRKPERIPGPLQNLVESLVEFLHQFIAGIIGERHARRFVPFLGTLGIYIWAMNLFGLIPFMDSPTSSLNVTFALALTVFLYVQWIGLRELGVIGYADHLAGQPRSLVGWLLVPLMLPIHVLGELAKPISLSCRLFGNIFGEDMLLVAFATLGVTTLAFTHLPFGLPLQLPFLLLALLTSTLQALVFMVLSTIYILLMLPHDHAHEHEALSKVT